MQPIKILLSILVAFGTQASLHAAPPPNPYFPITGGLVLALDASYIDTSDATQVNQQNGSIYVQNWLDYSGSGNNATQSVSWRQPLYVPNAINGLPALQFDGMNVYLTTALAQIQGNKTIIIVEKRTTTALGTEIASSSGTSGHFLGDSYNGASESEGRLNVAQDLQVPSSIGRFIVKSFVLSGSTGTLAVNGNSSSATIGDAASGTYTFSNPAAYHFAGQIAEVMIFNRALSTLEQQSIISYLNDKWGVQDTPPPVVAGLQLRLAANTINVADSNQVVQQNGTYYVKNWLDTSGNGYQASQSTSTLQPTYVSGALNGQPVVLFNGLGAYLTTTLPQISGDKSIFVVHRRVDSQLRTEIASSAVTSGMFLGNNYGVPTETEGRLYVAQDMQLPGYLNGYVLKSYIRSGGTATLMVNDTSSSAQAPDVAAGNYTISAPGHFPFSGPIAEVLIYNRALSETERQSVENYLSQKYGLWEVWLQVRAGLRLWLDANAIETNTSYQFPQVTGTGSNILVNSWNDRSPYGYNAVQTTSANQPIYWPAALGAGYNGTVGPVLRFNGAQFMPTSLPQISGDKSIFVVQRRRSQALGREISSTISSGHALENVASSTNEAKGPIGGAPSLQAPGEFYYYVVKDFIRSGSTESLWASGDSPATATVNDIAGGNYSISDSTAPFIGEIGTALIYSRAVSTAERFSIEDYLANRYSYPLNNIYSVSADLVLPSDTGTTTPAPGVCVKQTAPTYTGTGVYNTLYLPTDWQPGKTYPVIVEYPPNGGYTESGHTTTGNVEDCGLGYGISGGQGYIVIGMPCVGGSPLANQTLWWGSIASTEDYCLKEIQYVCQNYGGDSSAVFLAGFSRGAAACNLIGLYDSTIADTWLAFIPHSGYDYDNEYGSAYPNLPPASTRLARLSGRAQYVSQGSAIQGDWEVSYKYYLAGMGMNLSAFTFRTLPYSNHTGVWAERPIQLRRDIRSWMQQILATRPGTSSISGVVTGPTGAPIAGALVQSGTTHFTYTGSNGTYVLASLINSSRTVTVTAGSYTFTPQAVTVAGANVTNVNFQAGH